MKFVKPLKLAITFTILFVFTFFGFLALPIKAAEPENKTNLYTQNYYTETDDIITRRLAGMTSKEMVSTFILNKEPESKYFYNTLQDNDKKIYKAIYELFKDIDYDNINNAELALTKHMPELNNATPKSPLNRFLADYPGIFFIDNLKTDATFDAGSKTINIKIPSLARGNEEFNGTVFNKELQAYLSYILKVRREAVKHPIDRSKARTALLKLISFEHVKKQKGDLSNFGQDILVTDKVATSLAYAKAYNHVLELMHLSATLGYDNNNFGWTYLKVLDNYYIINVQDYLMSQKEESLNSNFLIAKIPFTPLLVFKGQIYNKDFEKQFSFRDSHVEYNEQQDVYQNRFDGGDLSSEMVENLGFSDAPFYAEKLPFTKVIVKDAKNLKFNTTYTYHNGTQVVTVKTAPTQNGFSGTVIMHMAVVENRDVYFEATCEYKIAKRCRVVFGLKKGNVTDATDRVVQCYFGDFVATPTPYELDGWVNVGYDPASQAKLNKPVTAEAITVEEKFEKPKHFKFLNENGEEVAFSPDREYTSDKVIDFFITTELPHGKVFVGYQIKKVYNESGEELTGEDIKEQFIDKYIGLNPKRGECKVVHSYAVQPKVVDIDIKITGSFFQRITKAKDTPEGYDAKFLVHPKRKLPSAADITISDNLVSARSGVVPLGDVEPRDLVYNKNSDIKEYDGEIYARGAHSNHQVVLKVKMVVNQQAFLTVGWLKKFWWIFPLIIIGIILIPVFIKLFFKIIKKIHRARKKRKMIAEGEAEIRRKQLALEAPVELDDDYDEDMDE